MTLAKVLLPTETGADSDGATAHPRRADDGPLSCRREKDRTVRSSVLVRTHYDFVWRLLRRSGLSREDAQDAAQEVFIVVSRRLDAIAEEHERSFLVGTALRVAATRRRSLARRRESLHEVSPALRDPRPDPEAAAEQRRALEIVDEILSGLPTELRTVFVLFELEDLEMGEIAEALDLPAGTIASRLRRARQAFRDKVRQHRARERFRTGGVS